MGYYIAQMQVMQNAVRGGSRVCRQTQVCASFLWEEAKVPGENPQIHANMGEHANIHTESPQPGVEPGTLLL